MAKAPPAGEPAGSAASVMLMGNGKQLSSQRLHLAQTAARLMREQGIRDFRTAKAKAAERLGVDFRQTPLPRNSEIEAAMAEHQRLFAGEAGDDRLNTLREAALEAMTLFSAFQPRLVGDVLSGLVTEYTDVQLHVFAEASESFDLFLQEQGIPFDLVERRFRYSRGAYHYYPVFRFTAGGVGFEAVLFPAGCIRRAPDSLVDGAPMPRAKRSEVARLADAGQSRD